MQASLVSFLSKFVRLDGLTRCNGSAGTIVDAGATDGGNMSANIFTISMS
jgi:hypothetical protein